MATQQYVFTDMEQFVTKAARQVSRGYRHYGVEFEDCAQEIRLWLYTSGEKKVRGWLKASPQRTTRIYRSMVDKAQAYAEQEKASRCGYDVDDVYWYTPGLVEGLLPLALDSTWKGDNPQMVEREGRNTTPPAERGNLLALVMDVRRALRARKNTVFFLEQDNSHPAWADEIQSLVDFLGGDKDYIGRRPVVANAQAQAITSQQESA